MAEENEVIVPAEEVEVVAPEVTPEVPEETQEAEVDWQSEAEKAKELANNYKIRAEKAEKKAKEALAPSPDTNQLSPADLLAVMRAEVHEDDMDRVQKFAKMEGMSIKDALKSDELKAILEVRKEQRNTASAANVSNVRRGPAKVTDDVLISNASKGKLPDSDEEIERLVGAMAKRK